VTDENEIVNYPTDFLNSFDLPEFLSHKLRLKIGSLIISLQNINISIFYNGTRSVIKKIIGNITKKTILSGNFR